MTKKVIGRAYHFDNIKSILIALPVIQSTASKQSSKHKALTPTSGMPRPFSIHYRIPERTSTSFPTPVQVQNTAKASDNDNRSPELYLIRCESDGCGRCLAADSNISSWKMCSRSSGCGPSGATPRTGFRRIADVAWMHRSSSSLVKVLHPFNGLFPGQPG